MKILTSVFAVGGLSSVLKANEFGLSKVLFFWEKDVCIGMNSLDTVFALHRDLCV